LGGGVDMHFKRVSLAVAERVHAAGSFLWVYTPNTWEQHRLLIDLGVDALTTDRPDIFLAGLRGEVGG
jgi:glycerophosphoryl diester phosphodiesterase